MLDSAAFEPTGPLMVFTHGSTQTQTPPCLGIDDLKLVSDWIESYGGT